MLRAILLACALACVGTPALAFSWSVYQDRTIHAYARSGGEGSLSPKLRGVIATIRAKYGRGASQVSAARGGAMSPAPACRPATTAGMLSMLTYPPRRGPMSWAAGISASSHIPAECAMCMSATAHASAASGRTSVVKLVWFIAFVHAQAGPQVINIGETTAFKDDAMCQAFGAVMKDRLADYARGVIKLDWSDKVAVAWKCEPAGDPS